MIPQYAGRQAFIIWERRSCRSRIKADGGLISGNVSVIGWRKYGRDGSPSRPRRSRTSASSVEPRERPAWEQTARSAIAPYLGKESLTEGRDRSPVPSGVQGPNGPGALGRVGGWNSTCLLYANPPRPTGGLIGAGQPANLTPKSPGMRKHGSAGISLRIPENY